MAIVLDGTNGITTNTGTLISATTIGVGGATPSTSGAGITFPATQSASTDANTLDDYEEGTWTPTITGASTAGTASYGTQTASYIKIGKLVFVSLYVNWSSATGTGQLQISGLPFAGAGGLYQGLSMSGISGVTGSTSGYTWFGRINSGESVIKILYLNTATTTPSDGAINVCAAGTLLFTGTYTI